MIRRSEIIIGGSELLRAHTRRTRPADPAWTGACANTWSEGV